MVNSLKTEAVMRMSAVALLASYSIGLTSTIVGGFLLGIACLLILYSIVRIFYLIRKKVIIKLLSSTDGEVVFWPGIMLLWTTISYSKGVNITGHVILLIIVIIVESIWQYTKHAVH